MTTRSERLGLEPGSVPEVNEQVEQAGMSRPEPLDREIAHSIAISLKRIADQNESAISIQERMVTAVETRKGQP